MKSRKNYRKILSLILFLLPYSLPAFSAIVINEIMYHPASENDNDEYVELYNIGAEAVTLTNYAFTEGITYTFTSSVTIPAKGYLVVARDAAKIKSSYGIDNVVGNYNGHLSDGGETLVLEDNLGRIAAELTYTDSAPWPVAADGNGPSLELMNSNSSMNDPFNWRASGFPGSGKPWGTPGKTNTTISTDLPPKINNPRHRPETPKANDPIALRAEVADDTGVFRVWAEYKVNRVPETGVNPSPLPVTEDQWITLEMYDDGTHGDRVAGDYVFESDLPILPAGVIVRYKIHALDFLMQENVAPDPANYPHQLGLYVQTTEAISALPVYRIFLTDADLILLKNNSFFSPSDNAYNDTVRGAFIDHTGMVYDEVKFRFWGTPEERQQIKPGWKIHFNEGYSWNGINELNLDALFHPNNPERRGDAGLYESTAWEIFRMAGVPSIQTQAVRIHYNGKNQGIYLQKEDIEEDYLTRIGKDRDSNLYESQGDPTRPDPGTRGDESVLPAVEDYQKTYDNVTHTDAAYTDLISFIQELNTKSGNDLSQFFTTHFAGDAFLSYLAAGIVCVDTDRVWHNHFLYHDQTTNLWELFPANLTQTFEKVAANIFMDVKGYPTVNGPWPLATQFLSLPENQEQYLERVRKYLAEIFAEPILYPKIDRFAAALRDEAEMDRSIWSPSATGFKILSDHAKDLKSFISKRRQQLIAQLPKPVLISNAFTRPVVPKSSEPIQFFVDVLSALPVESVSLYYKNNTSLIEQTLPMQLSTGEISTLTLYQGTLPPQPNGSSLQYYYQIKLSDGTLIRNPEAVSQTYQLRVIDDNSPNETTIVINEIMYHSPITDNEWIELYNSGTAPVDLSGWTYKDDDDTHAFVIPADTVMQPEGYMVLAFDSALVRQLYGITNVLGNVTFNLGNGGDVVRLFNAGGKLIHSVTFLDQAPWPTELDGNGPSLELIEPTVDFTSPAAWRASHTQAPMGTPGKRNSVSPPPTAIHDWSIY